MLNNIILFIVKVLKSRFFKINNDYTNALRINCALKKIKNNSEHVLKRIKKRSGKIRVAFLVSETAKWQFQELYETMEKSEDFTPFVLFTKLNSKKNTSYYEKEFLFFEENDIKAYKAYNSKLGKYIPLNKFSPDIVFFQQPWGLKKKQEIEYTSKFALTFYVPYSIANHSMFYNMNKLFMRGLKAYFVFSKNTKDLYLNVDSNIDNIEVVGHPKLDTALKVISKHKKQSPKKTIIYAPHHSFADTGLKWATFSWSAYAVLNLAKKHTQFNWVLKPHPLLNSTVLQNDIMTAEELNNYYLEWNKFGTVVNGGNYFNLFAESDLMISDCGSFMIEYSLTKKPLIHLNRKDSCEREYDTLKVLLGYYSVLNEIELQKCFTDLLIEGKDTLKNKREEIFNDFDFGNATKNIITYLNKILN